MGEDASKESRHRREPALPALIVPLVSYASRRSPRSKPFCAGLAPEPARRYGRPCRWRLRRSLPLMRWHGSRMLATRSLLNPCENCCKGQIRPELVALLHVCFACGTTLSDLLQANPKTLHPVVTSTTVRSQVRRRVRFPATFKFDVQVELQNTLAREKYPPSSLTEVARQCGCHNQTLRRCNPAACDAISGRYRAYVRQMKEQRLRDLGDTFRHVGRQFRS
jgi:hypothetical protein